LWTKTGYVNTGVEFTGYINILINLFDMKSFYQVSKFKNPRHTDRRLCEPACWYCSRLVKTRSNN